MEIKQKKTSPTEVELTVSVGKDELEHIKRSVFNELRPRVKASGFRPGRAPNEIVERELGSDTIQSEVIEAAAQQAYGKALKEHDIRPLSQPHVELSKFVPYSELSFKLTVQVFPEVSLPNYTKIKKVPKPATVDDADVTKVIEGLRIRAARRSDVKRAAQPGDEVVIDFDGTRGGRPVSGASGRDYPAVIGSGRLIKGFEENLIGLKASDNKKFTVIFPADYHEKSLQKQKVEFAVTVKKVVELSLPKLDDGFAKEAGPFKTVEELKKDIRQHLQAEKEQLQERELEAEVVREVVDKTKLVLPPALVEQQFQHLVAELERELAARGLSREDYLKAEGKTEADLRKELEPEAERRIKTALTLTEVARQEKLDVSPQELEIRLQILQAQYPDQALQAELAKPEVKNDIANQLLTEKTVARLVEYAKSGKITKKEE